MQTFGKTSIANMSLIDIGSSPISSFDPPDGSVSADHVAAIWDTLVAEVLAVHNWDFAKKVSALAEDVDYTIDDEKWEHAYELPRDCIKSRYLSNRDYMYEIRDLHLLCNREGPNAVLTYTRFESNVDNWDILFRQAFSKRLSGALCRPLKKRGSMARDLFAEFRQMISEAQQSDAAQSNQSMGDEYRHTVENDSWLQARN